MHSSRNHVMTSVIIGGIVGLIFGGFVGYLNRPTYLGGLIHTTAQDLGQNSQLLQDAAGPILGYGFCFSLFGVVAGAIIANVKAK